MKRRVTNVTLAVCLSAFLLCGCGSENGSSTTAETAAATTEAVVTEAVTTETVSTETVTTEELPTEVVSTEAIISDKPTQDRSGNAITIPAEVNKIVSMAPSTTELLIDLGLADRIVACDTYSGYSTFASNLTAGIPQFDMMAPDNEAIAALKPDIVFTTGMSSATGEDVYSALKNAGVCVADIPSSTSIQGIEEDIQFIGDAVGESEKAAKITADMEKFVEAVKAANGSAERKKVLYIMSVPTADYPDVYTCGKGTYMDEIFTLVGAENIAGDIDYAWPALSEEDIVSKNPDVIIVGDTYTPDAVNAILSIDAWKDINAIKNQAVYSIDGDAFNQPNQYVMNSAYEIGLAIYPDIFSGIKKPF